MDAGMSAHWLTLYDPADGQPYGQVCDCEIGVDHDGAGNFWDDDTGQHAPPKEEPR
jgi:hypothetical protein